MRPRREDLLSLLSGRTLRSSWIFDLASSCRRLTRFPSFWLTKRLRLISSNSEMGEPSARGGGANKVDRRSENGSHILLDCHAPGMAFFKGFSRMIKTNPVIRAIVASTKKKVECFHTCQ